ncbi:MAG: MFS transporter [Solirubrobacterales bacterium]|nr:MFS transporter [Solirubrobacterales bacterium]
MATTASERPLRRAEWRLLAVLGLPTFAFALATTVATTYLPVLAATFAPSATTIGLLIATEGIVALLLAVPVGALSDRARHRRVFVLGATPVLVLALAAMGFSGSLWVALLCVTVFFLAYYVGYEPYRALYPDLVDEDVAGRAQSTQALWRGIGTLAAIGAGGILFKAAQWLPFVAGAAVAALSVVVFGLLLDRVKGRNRRRQASGGEDLRGRLRELLRGRGDIRAFLVANALWELALGALKTFMVLYLTKGLGIDIGLGAAAIAAAAVFIAIASPVSGKLADRFGARRVMQVSLLVYGAGLLVPLFVTSKAVIAGIAPLIAFGGGVVMTLPYALLIPLMPREEHGLSTGLYSLSRGVGTALGPLLAGVAITVLDGPFAGTQGYQAMWGVCALAILASVPVLARVRD